MMNRINKILIGLLWLLASTLGITFWFNTVYGFNIFSAQHWQHLSYMQATGQAVRTSFYISMVVAIIIVTFGFYILLQPRFRRITLPLHDSTTPPPAPVAKPSQVHESVSATPTAPDTPAPQPTQQPPTAPTIVRPPRLNIPVTPQNTAAPRVPLMPVAQPKIDPETEYADIRNIFESAGYVFKGMPKIKGVQTATIAIGTGEILWLGAVGVKTSDVQRAVDTLAGVFTDTLEDIEIHINAFVIAPTDSANDTNILRFANTDELREYIMAHPNTAPSADETENFDAYSGYIGTVVDYIGKI